MENRINPLSVGTTSERQTPNNEFGLMLARGLSTGTTAVAGAAAAVVPGGGIVTAAINQAAGSAMKNAAMARGAGASGGLAGGAATGTSRAAGAAVPSPAGDGLDAQRELMLQNQQWTSQYLALQNEMQRESREFSAISNILKVRHETAKTAINNIR